MKLAHRTSFTLYPKPPFHFDGTFHKPSHFQNTLKLDAWVPGTFWQALRVGKLLFGLGVVNKGTVARPRLHMTLFSQRQLTRHALESVKQEVAYRFGLDRDSQEFIALAERDRRFAPVFKKWLGMRSSSQHTLYELLVISLVLQNATVRRSSQMLDALLGRFGTRIECDGRSLYAMWLPARMKNVSEVDLRKLKIGYRAKFLKRLSADVATGKVDEVQLRGMDKDHAKQELMKLYGVGPETARILQFEVFHHYDAFDHIAPWQQKIYSRLFYGRRLVPVRKIERDIKRRYGKYAMLAVHYIWEDAFWRRKHEHIPWLEKEIRV